ncbi:hypothetical protein PMKS-003390 [Pichia membranifaciens]|uniref:Peptidase A1 domain-containing protein n=1 Tax=Pichia membranifaciens TaxID=4926 RepID=A0A1Q2YK15_9ASCO|nr:hypothetical protein PMKS-003390 [Pichia membranifaciens]
MLLNSIVLSALLNVVNAYPLYKRDSNSSVTATNSTNEDKYLSFDFISQELSFGSDFTAIQVAIGSSNQTLLLKLDTTTSDFWVNANTNEFCLAYYPVDDYLNETSPNDDWNAFNTELEGEFEEAVQDFEAAENSQFSIAATASENIQSYLGERQTAIQSLLSQQRASVSQQIEEYLSTATATGDDAWSTFEAGLPSQVNEIGATITSQTAVWATPFSGNPSLITSYSQFSTASFTYVTEDDGDSVNVFTYLNSDDPSPSWVAYSSASWVELNKREDGWEKFTSGAAEFFDDLKKRDEEATTTKSVHHKSKVSSGISQATKTSGVASSKASGVSHHASSYTSARASSVVLAPSSTLSSAYASASSPYVDYAIEEYMHQINGDCGLYGVFNESASTSFQSSDEFFVSSDELSYGILGNDTISVNGFSVNTTFGVSELSESNIGVFGLGKTTGNSTFVSFTDVLAQNGHILKSLYSFVIGFFDSQVTFGAINYNYITDSNLTLFPLLNDTESIGLTLSGLSLEDPELNSTTPIAHGKTQAFIDTTVSNVYFPQDVLDAFATTLNSTFSVTYVDTIERYVLYDNHNESASSPWEVEVVFDFQGTEYSLSLADFLVSFDNSTGFSNDTDSYDGYADDSAEDYYVLSILPSDDDSVVLGLDFLADNFLVVVDFEASEIGLAYFNFILSEDEFVVIEDDIPGATVAPQYDNFYGSDNVTKLSV